MDYSQRYERISRPFRTNTRAKAVAGADRVLVWFFAVAYVALLVYLGATGDPRLLKAVAVPAATFAFVTLLRVALNRPRPYEAWDIDPLVVKETHGKSFPSRHMASSTVIACTFFWICPFAGIVFFAGCACVAFTRIVGGVHYPSDIAAAIAIAIACSLIGFSL